MMSLELEVRNNTITLPPEIKIDDGEIVSISIKSKNNNQHPPEFDREKALEAMAKLKGCLKGSGMLASLLEDRKRDRESEERNG